MRSNLGTTSVLINLFLLTTRENKLAIPGKHGRFHNMLVSKFSNLTTIDSIPQFDLQVKYKERNAREVHMKFECTVKSAEAVTARILFEFNLADQTAPLCPVNVPIQSPVFPFRSIGFLSLKPSTRSAKNRRQRSALIGAMHCSQT